MDVGGSVHTSHHNMRYLLTILDMTMRFIDAVPMPEATANNCAQALIDASISQFGLPACQAPDLPCGIVPGSNTYDPRRSGGSRPGFAHQHSETPTQIAGESLPRSSPNCPPHHLAHENATGNAQGHSRRCAAREKQRSWGPILMVPSELLKEKEFHA